MRLFMIVAGVLCVATLALWAPTAHAVPKVDIFIYTEITQWIAQGTGTRTSRYIHQRS